MNEIEWKSPPPPTVPRSARVAAALRSKPGEWALIATQEGLLMMPWWAPLNQSDEFEVRIVPTTERAFGPREIYARYCGVPAHGEVANQDGVTAQS